MRRVRYATRYTHNSILPFSGQSIATGDHTVYPDNFPSTPKQRAAHITCVLLAFVNECGRFISQGVTDSRCTWCASAALLLSGHETFLYFSTRHAQSLSTNVCWRRDVVFVAGDQHRSPLSRRTASSLKSSHFNYQHTNICCSRLTLVVCS
jgi:hypothetical protein